VWFIEQDEAVCTGLVAYVHYEVLSLFNAAGFCFLPLGTATVFLTGERGLKVNEILSYVTESFLGVPPLPDKLT
jgi:hypothetical protein